MKGWTRIIRSISNSIEIIYRFVGSIEKSFIHLYRIYILATSYCGLWYSTSFPINKNWYKGCVVLIQVFDIKCPSFHSAIFFFFSISLRLEFHWTLIRFFKRYKNIYIRRVTFDSSLKPYIPNNNNIFFICQLISNNNHS